MRLIAVLISAFIICLFSCPLGICGEKRAKEEEKPAVLSAAELIARGKTFTDHKAKNVSFTLSATKALLKISF